MIHLPQQAQQIIDTLKKAGFEAYAVGGSVRDLFINRPTKGWDFTTNAPPEDILKLFPDSFYDNQFGTVGIKIYDLGIKNKGQKLEENLKPIDIYEITTYRSEEGYKDHRHPDKIIWGITIQEDLSRRDFTINAIAYDGKTVVDPHEGQKDIEKKLVKTVGDPNARFSEDALRMMRAVRIAAELGFVIDEPTLAAIKTNAGLLRHISLERIRDELTKILAAVYASDAILVLRATGILAQILPEFDKTFGVDQKSPKRHHLFDVGTHSVMALKHCPSQDPLVLLATLLHDIGKVETFNKDATGLITFYNHEVVGAHLVKTIADRLRFSREDREKLVTLVRWHQFTVDERQTDSALRRFIRHTGKENLPEMLALRIGDRLGGGARETSWRLELFKKRLEEVQKQPFTVADLAIDGFEVMKELDTKPGPMVGKALNALFALVDSDKLANDHDALLAKLRELKSSLLTS